jgi:hypothetical protein
LNTVARTVSSVVAVTTVSVPSASSTASPTCRSPASTQVDLFDPKNSANGGAISGVLDAPNFDAEYVGDFETV